MSKINLDSIIYDTSKKPAKDVEGNDLKLREVIKQSLLSQYPDERTDGTEKYKKWTLCQKIDSADSEVELMAEDISLIKQVIGKYQVTIVVGQAFDLLENKQ